MDGNFSGTARAFAAREMTVSRCRVKRIMHVILSKWVRLNGTDYMAQSLSHMAFGAQRIYCLFI